MAKFEEIECKFLDVDVSGLRSKLAKLGASKRFTRVFKRYIFDFPGWPLDQNNSWLRVRDEGDKVTVSFKQRQGVKKGQNDAGMKEVEVSVDDFEKMAEVFRSIGMVTKFYEENRRTLFELDGVEVAIDEWPMIPPYVEIEGPSWAQVDGVAKKLGFDPKDKMICSTMQVYEKYGIEEKAYEVLTFKKQIRRTS